MKLCPVCRKRFDADILVCPDDGATLLSVHKDDASVGRLFVDRFLLLGTLGKGGFGSVFKAWQISTEREVALKVLLPQYTNDENLKKRFIREARTTAKLTSPHTITLHDFGETSEGELFIAMELLRGKTLSEVIKRTGRIPYHRALSIVVQICRSLEEAHAKDIIHRDLKPANVWVTTDRDGQDHIKVLDFGIAKILDEFATVLTSQGATCGTPAFMAPEQVTGDVIQPCTDIYALGIMLFQMITGSLPFVAPNSTSMMMMHVYEPFPSLEASVPSLDLPPDVDRILRGCVEKHPGNRYGSCTALRRECETLLGDVTSPVSLTIGEADTLVPVLEVTATATATPLAFDNRPPAIIEEATTSATAGSPRARTQWVFIGLASLLLAVAAFVLVSMFGPDGAWDREAGDTGRGTVQDIAASTWDGAARADATPDIPDFVDAGIVEDTPAGNKDPSEDISAAKDDVSVVRDVPGVGGPPPDAEPGVADVRGAEEPDEVSGTTPDLAGGSEINGRGDDAVPSAGRDGGSGPGDAEKTPGKDSPGRGDAGRTAAGGTSTGPSSTDRPAPQKVGVFFGGVVGHLDPVAAKARIQTTNAALIRCYRKHPPKNRVRYEMNVMVSPAGEVLSARMKDGDGGTGFSGCALSRLEALKFPPFEEGTFAIVHLSVSP